jgi:3-methyladenine DNA glycosylase AlkD
MTSAETLKLLASLGTEQTRKTLQRHGVQTDLYGVSYKDFGVLKKKLKVDHQLALELWESRNHDARILAMMIADPAKVNAKTAEKWVGDLNNHVVAGAFAGLIAESSIALETANKWIKSADEMTATAGWDVLCRIVKVEAAVSDAECNRYLELIEKNIQKEKNRVKQGMNNAMIAIGLRDEKIRPAVLAVARRIGKVHIDHGDTSCKTPDAVAYIEKALGRKLKAKSK